MSSSHTLYRDLLIGNSASVVPTGAIQLGQLDVRAVLEWGLTCADDRPTTRVARRLCYAIGRHLVDKDRVPYWAWNMRSRGIVGCSDAALVRGLTAGDEYGPIGDVDWDLFRDAWLTAVELGFDGRLINPNGEP